MIQKKDIYLVIFIVFLFNNINTAFSNRSPVIFVPGDGGSQIEAQLSKNSSVHVFCQKQSTWFNIWLNLELLVPLVIDCWIDNVKLYYDNETRTTSNPPGVDIRIPGWGSPEVVEWLDPSKASSGAYFKDIGNALVDMGYERNISIRGAPYDFRRGPNENEQFLLDLKVLVEETYELNNKSSVTLLAHSMGAPMTLIFLQRQSSAWKDKYIRRFITLAGAWGGSVKAVKVFAMGDDLGSYVLRSSILREEQISCPSLAFLLPSPLFWKQDELLVTTKTRNYTMGQLNEFFDDLQYETGWQMRQDNIKYSLDFTPPGVELHCLYGSAVPTVDRLLYTKGQGLDGTPTLINGEGDGTVNARSLEGCAHWRSIQKQPISTMELPGVDHMGVLSHVRVLDYINGLLKKDLNDVL